MNYPEQQMLKILNRDLLSNPMYVINNLHIYDWESDFLAMYGVIVHKIDKWYPSSKTCECGCINKGLSLRDRTWVCPACGAINDRDVLAARNILRKGISELESMGNSGCRNAGVPYVCIQ